MKVIVLLTFRLGAPRISLIVNCVIENASIYIYQVSLKLELLENTLKWGKIWQYAKKNNYYAKYFVKMTDLLANFWQNIFENNQFLK